MLRGWRILAIGMFVLATSTASTFARGNSVNFYGTVLSVSMESSTAGTITLRLMGAPVTVGLTGDTKIEAHGDEVGFDGIGVGDFVKVLGFFSNSSIVAREIVVIDRGDGEFRLRGAITEVDPTSEGVVITVLGIDVLVNDDTQIERRGPQRGFTSADLAPGMIVDTRGQSVEGDFVARRVKVGLREDDAIRVDFGGRITSVESTKLVVDTEGGSTAVVLIGSDTRVIGTPAVGRFAEVRGVLNSNLEVVASTIVIKSSRDSDDHVSSPGSVEFKKEIPLRPVVDGAGIRGEAEIELKFEGREFRQEFEASIFRAQPNTEYRVVVEIAGAGSLEVGAFRTNGEGTGEIKHRNLRILLPDGKTVRDLVSVQVLQGSTVVLRGVF